MCTSAPGAALALAVALALALAVAEALALAVLVEQPLAAAAIWLAQRLLAGPRQPQVPGGQPEPGFRPRRYPGGLMNVPLVTPGCYQRDIHKPGVCTREAGVAGDASGTPVAARRAFRAAVLTVSVRHSGSGWP